MCPRLPMLSLRLLLTLLAMGACVPLRVAAVSRRVLPGHCFSIGTAIAPACCTSLSPCVRCFCCCCICRGQAGQSLHCLLSCSRCSE